MESERVDRLVVRVYHRPVSGRVGVLAAVALGLACVLPAAAMAVVPARSLSVFPVRESPGWIALGPDGAMWVTTESRRLVRIDATGHVSYKAVPEVPESPARFGLGAAGIVTGPDGALWFAESEASGFGRYVPGQTTFQEYPVPGSGSPLFVAVGPDRAIWLTDPGAHIIARLGPDNSIKSLNLGEPVEPSEIVAGPDNALWVGDYSAPRLLRVQTSGSVQMFPFGPNRTKAVGLAVGPDGALWFSMYGPPARIARMTLDGRIREFKRGLPARAEVEDIAVGPDGNLWFTEITSGAIGRITLDGRITMFRMFRWSPENIAAGPDNAMWFTNLDQRVVGRVPVNVCASRRVIHLHFRAPKHDPILRVRLDFLDDELTRRGRWNSAPVALDLRGYIGRTVRVGVHLRTAAGHHIHTRRTFHTCR
jgi:virginiamycin B lyase